MAYILIVLLKISFDLERPQTEEIEIDDLYEFVGNAPDDPPQPSQVAKVVPGAKGK